MTENESWVGELQVFCGFVGAGCGVYTATNSWMMTCIALNVMVFISGISKRFMRR